MSENFVIEMSYTLQKTTQPATIWAFPSYSMWMKTSKILFLKTQLPTKTRVPTHSKNSMMLPPNIMLPQCFLLYPKGYHQLPTTTVQSLQTINRRRQLTWSSSNCWEPQGNQLRNLGRICLAESLITGAQVPNAPKPKSSSSKTSKFLRSCINLMKEFSSASSITLLKTWRISESSLRPKTKHSSWCSKRCLATTLRNSIRSFSSRTPRSSQSGLVHLASKQQKTTETWSIVSKTSKESSWESISPSWNLINT